MPKKWNRQTGEWEEDRSVATGTIDRATGEPLTAAKPAPADDDDDETWLDYIGTTGADLLKGAAKELMAQGIRGGELLRKLPGVNALDKLMTPFAVNTEPSNTAQRIGGTGLQITEAMAPTKALAGLGASAARVAAPALARFAPVAVEAGAGGALATLQGGNPIIGAAGGAVGSAVGQGLQRAGGALRESAEKGVQQALGATKERYKALAERLTPEILKRGLRGSRAGLLERAGAAAETAEQDIDNAIQQFGSRQVGVQPLLSSLETAKDAFRIPAQVAGAPAIVIEPRAIKQIEKLQDVITKLGPDARVDQLIAVRRMWDKVVDQAGGYSHRAAGGIGIGLKDQSEASAKREGATAIRQLLNVEVPELTALNKEFSFWKGLDDVLTQTVQRTGPQGPGILKAGAEAAGQVVGGLAGSGAGPAGAVVGAIGIGKVAKFAQSVFTSPRWRLASAQMKDDLADAIMSGNLTQITAALGRIGATQSAQLTR